MTLRYDAPSTRCLGKCQPGIVALRTVVVDEWDFTYDLGCYNCRNVGGTSKPSCHREGRAWDCGIRMVGRGADPRGWQIARWLVANADALCVQVVIWDRKIWSVGRRGEGWRDYDGQSPHLDHIHVEENWDGARALTVEKVRALLGDKPTPAPTEPEETFPMTGIFHPDASAGNDTNALWLLDGGVYDAIPGDVLNEVKAVLANRGVKHDTIEISGPFHRYLRSRHGA